MINIKRLEELDFNIVPGKYDDTLVATFGEEIGLELWPMKYTIGLVEQNGLIVQDYGFYVYGFRLETIPDIEEVEEFVDLYKEGMLC